MNTIKQSSIFKFIRTTSMLAAFSLGMGSYNAQAKLPLNVFKGVSDVFPEGKKYLSPTIGMAALDGGVIENLRFFGNYTPAYKMSKDGVRERDYANDYSNDPIWQMIRILFPSTAGQLSGDSTHRFNFGKYVKKTMTVALLLKYTDDIRSGKQVDEEKLRNDIMLTMGHKFQGKMTEAEKINLAHDLLDQDQSTIYEIMTETQLAIEGLNSYFIQQQIKKTPVDQRVIGQAKNDLLRNLTQLIKKFNDDRIEALFMEKIKELYAVGSSKNQTPNTAKRNPLDPEFFYRVKNEVLKVKSPAEDILRNTQIEDVISSLENKEPRNKFINAFKESTLTPLLAAIKNSIMAEQRNQDAFIPQYTPEQIITAFFDYKFSTRGDVIQLLRDLQRLDPQIMDVSALNTLDPTDLLTGQDLPNISMKSPYTLDDILALSTADIWLTMPTPYRVGAPILSNGSTKIYDRKTNSFVGGEFADCVEISIRHLINFFLYNPALRNFDFTGLTAYRNSLKNISPEQERDFQAFIKFFELQKVDLVNDGSMNMRSEWNRVVGDLNAPNESSQTAVRYRQGSNELDAGFINLMKIFNKVLGIQFDLAPNSESTLDQKKEWLKNSFEKLFKALNPHEGYSIDLDMGSVKANEKEMSGIVKVTVTDQRRNMLYSFDFRSDPDQHGQLQNYQVSNKFQVTDYSQELINFKFHGFGAEYVIWLLDKNARVRQSKEQDWPLLYQLFDEGLADNNAKIRFLEKVEQRYDTNENLFLTPEFKNILKRIIGDLNLSDPEILKKSAPIVMKLIEKVGFKEVITEALKMVQMGLPPMENLDMNGMQLLLWILKINNSSLTSLNLQFLYFNVREATTFAEALKENKTLTFLDLSFSSNDVNILSVLDAALKENKTLTSLTLSIRVFKPISTELENLLNALKENTSLTSLEIHNPHLNEKIVTALARALKVNKTLSSLSLYHANLSDFLFELTEALKENTSIITLDLGSNDISDEGAKALAEALKVNTSITSVDLSDNLIGDEVKRELREMWAQTGRNPGKLEL